MWLIGLVWVDLATPWSNNGKIYTVLKLASHFKTIKGTGISLKIPSKPPVLLPHQKDLPVLGKQALDVKVTDSAQLNNTNEF